MFYKRFTSIKCSQEVSLYSEADKVGLNARKVVQEVNRCICLGRVEKEIDERL